VGGLSGKNQARITPFGAFRHQGETTEANFPKASGFTSCARMTSDMTEVDARAASPKEPKKYNLPLSARIKKQAFKRILHPGN
jgi:hypothetical protein